MSFFRKSDDDSDLSVSISTDSFVRLAFVTVSTFLLLMAVEKAAHALLLIFLAFFLALALNGPVQWLARHLPGKLRGSRTLATSLSFLIITLLLAGFIASLVPPLVRQTQSFVDSAPTLVRDFRSQDSTTGRFIREHNLEKQVNNFSNQLSDRLKNAGGAAFSTLQRIGSSVFSLLSVLVLTFMMLIEGPRWLAFMRELIPEKRRKKADVLARDMYMVIRGFVNGQVTLAALAAVLIMPAILILNIPYPVALMVIVFICGLIPMVGHTIGAIIVTLVALFESTSAAIIILAYYILYQQFENIFIQPKIQANATNMSPLLVFASVIIGVSFGGLFGGLLAIPVAGCIRIVLLDYLRSKKIISHAEHRELTTETK
jgi:predicted PurR-regulated permease PerM